MASRSENASTWAFVHTQAVTEIENTVYTQEVTEIENIVHSKHTGGHWDRKHNVIHRMGDDRRHKNSVWTHTISNNN